MIKLLPVIKTYVDASNAHDVQLILSCFSENAVVRDEGETLHGRKAIEDWVTRTIEKYKFQFKPVTFRENNAEVVVAIEVSGMFDGSPITLDYRFTIEGDKILSLTID
jgi:ketosteroid isomerase-like protein